MLPQLSSKKSNDGQLDKSDAALSCAFRDKQRARADATCEKTENIRQLQGRKLANPKFHVGFTGDTAGSGEKSPNHSKNAFRADVFRVAWKTGNAAAASGDTGERVVRASSAIDEEILEYDHHLVGHAAHPELWRTHTTGEIEVVNDDLSDEDDERDVCENTSENVENPGQTAEDSEGNDRNGRRTPRDDAAKKSLAQSRVSLKLNCAFRDNKEAQERHRNKASVHLAATGKVRGKKLVCPSFQGDKTQHETHMKNKMEKHLLRPGALRREAKMKWGFLRSKSLAEAPRVSTAN